jgi:hypothetical protein
MLPKFAISLRHIAAIVILWLLLAFLPSCNFLKPSSASAIYRSSKTFQFVQPFDSALQSIMGLTLQPSDKNSVTVVAQRSRSKPGPQKGRRSSRSRKRASAAPPIIILEGEPQFKGITAGDSRSTLAHIRKKLGPPEGGTQQWLVYNKKYGVDFWGSARNKPVHEIRLNRGFKGRLNSGISLQSPVDDVFKAYGMPTEEIIVEDLHKNSGYGVLFKTEKGAKIEYYEHGLLFWFSEGQITQIVVYKKGATFKTPPRKIATVASVPSKKELQPLEVPPVEESPRWAPVRYIDMLWSYVKILWVYWYLTLAFLLIWAYLLRDAFRWLYYQVRPLPEGRLIVMAAPASGKVENINIWFEARRHKKRKLLVGSSSEADICLPHRSVEAFHARISARRTESGPATCIEQLDEKGVFVNNAPKTFAKLDTNSEVQIGKYRFLYERPSEYRQVQVQYKNGRVIEGVPTSWDIASKGFALIPSTAPSWADARFIRFEKLKGVYFVEDWDKDVRKNMLKSDRFLRKQPVNIRFLNGETAAGYLLGDYKEQSPRFYFFPKDQSGDVVYVLVERTSVDSLKRIKRGE